MESDGGQRQTMVGKQPGACPNSDEPREGTTDVVQSFRWRIWSVECRLFDIGGTNAVARPPTFNAQACLFRLL